MKLSIIIPIYNASSFLRECLNSVVNELAGDEELILIDDGSKDNSYEICKEYENKNIKIIKNCNHGVSYTRNEGIKLATGEWVMFVDSDDLMQKGWMNILNNSIDSESDIIYYFQDCDFVKLNSMSKEELINEIVVNSSYAKYLSTPWARIFKRKLLLENEIKFNDDIVNGEDMLFNIEAVIASCKYKFVNQSIYKYHCNQNSATHKFNPKMFKSDLVFQKRLLEILRISEFAEDYIKRLSNYCIKNAIYTLSNNFSRQNKYRLFKNECKKLKQEPYNSYKVGKVNDKKNVLITLLFHNNYLIPYWILKLNNMKYKKTVDLYIAV